MIADEQYYAALEARYMRDEIDWSQAGEPQYGDQACAEAQTLLMRVTHTATIQEAMRVGRERSHLSTDPNVTLRTRVPKPLIAEVMTIARQHQTTVSQIVREAMTEYVDKMAA